MFLEESLLLGPIQRDVVHTPGRFDKERPTKKIKHKNIGNCKNDC